MQWVLRATDRIVRWYAPVRAALQTGAGEIAGLESDWSAMSIPRETRAELLRSLDTWERLGDAERVGVGVLHHAMMTLNRLVGREAQNDYLTIELWAERENTNATPWDALLHPLFAELFATYRGGRGKPILAYGYTQANPIATPFSVDVNEYAGTIVRIEYTGDVTVEIVGKRRLTNGSIETATHSVTLTGSGVYFTPDAWVEIGNLRLITTGTAAAYASLGAGRLF
jgi:hypothetical protein